MKLPESIVNDILDLGHKPNRAILECVVDLIEHYQFSVQDISDFDTKVKFTFNCVNLEDGYSAGVGKQLFVFNGMLTLDRMNKQCFLEAKLSLSDQVITEQYSSIVYAPANEPLNNVGTFLHKLYEDATSYANAAFIASKRAIGRVLREDNTPYNPTQLLTRESYKKLSTQGRALLHILLQKYYEKGDYKYDIVDLNEAAISDLIINNWAILADNGKSLVLRRVYADDFEHEFRDILV